MIYKAARKKQTGIGTPHTGDMHTLSGNIVNIRWKR
jgi:hypothetical protein